jgi:uncharacterized protein YbaR (Trm112 family)
MQIPDWLLEILVCPERKDLSLKLVGQSALERLNQRIVNGEVKNRAGKKVEKVIEEGLLREDGKVLYPIRDGIPVLLIEEGIELVEGDVVIG